MIRSFLGHTDWFWLVSYVGQLRLQVGLISDLVCSMVENAKSPDFSGEERTPHKYNIVHEGKTAYNIQERKNDIYSKKDNT